MNTWLRRLVVVFVVVACVSGTLASALKAADGMAKPSPARLTGMRAAIDDLANGSLRQKEYPPLPYPPGYPDFIQLLRSECGVEWQVIDSPVFAKELRDEVGGYNDVMPAEIEHRFGRDIFEKLRKKALKSGP